MDNNGLLQSLSKSPVYHKYILMPNFSMAFIQNLKNNCLRNLEYLSKISLLKQLSEIQIKYCIRICSGACGDINIDALLFLFLHFSEFFPEEFEHANLRILLNADLPKLEKLIIYVHAAFDRNYILSVSNRQKMNVFIGAYHRNLFDTIEILLENEWDAFVTEEDKKAIFSICRSREMVDVLKKKWVDDYAIENI
jgi:hypothetical protein